MPPPGNGPAVGISVDLDLGSTLQRLADLQEALGTLGRLQGSPGNRADYHLGAAQGSFALDNPQPYPVGSPDSRPQTTPARPDSPSGGFSGSVSQVHIAQVQSLTIQTAAQVTVYGAGSGAGGQATGTGIPAEVTATAPSPPSAQQQVTAGQTAPATAPSTGAGAAATQPMTPVAGINTPVAGAPAQQAAPGAGGPAGAGSAVSGAVASAVAGSGGGGGGGKGGGKGGGGGFDPDETIMPGQWTAPPQPWPSSDHAPGSQIPEFARDALGMLGIYQILNWAAQSGAASWRGVGGDVRQSQVGFDQASAIPIIGPLINSFAGPQFNREQSAIGLQAVQQYMGLPGPAVQIDRDPNSPNYGRPIAPREYVTQSPAFTAMETQLNLQGLSPGASLRDRFAQQETTVVPQGTPGAFYNPGSGLSAQDMGDFRIRNPKYLDPAVREAVLGAYQRTRTSGAVMGTYGFDPIDESQSSEPEQLFRIAMAQGDYGAAQTLGGLVSPEAAGEVRQFGGRMLREQFRGEIGQLAYGREQAASSRFRQRGNFLSAASIQYDSASYQEDIQHSLEAQIAQLDDLERQALGRLDSQGNHIPLNPALSGAIAQRKTALEAQREQAEGAAFGARLGAADTRYQGFSAEYGGGIAALSAGAQTGFMTGAGSERRQTLALQEVRFAGQQAEAARRYEDEVRATGATHDVLMGAERTRRQAELGLEQQRVQAAQTPVDLGLQRQLSSSQYQSQVLQSVPGAYGNLRGAIRDQLGILEQEGGQVAGQMEQQRRSGQLNPAAEFEYQQRLQQIGVQQASAFEQLSHGWENRVMSRIINSPGSFNLEGRGFSMMNTVTAGAWNPHFGARPDQLPFFLSYANLARIPVSGLPGVAGLGPGVPGLPPPPGMQGDGDNGFGVYGPVGGAIGLPGSVPGSSAPAPLPGLYEPPAPFMGPGGPDGPPGVSPAAPFSAKPPAGAPPAGSPFSASPPASAPSGRSPAGASDAPSDAPEAGSPFSVYGGRSGSPPHVARAHPPHIVHDPGTGRPLLDPSGQPIRSDELPGPVDPSAYGFGTGIPAPVPGKHYLRDFDAERRYWESSAPEMDQQHTVVIDQRGSQIKSANFPGQSNLPGMEIIGHSRTDPRYQQPRNPSSTPTDGASVQGYSPRFGGASITSHGENGVHTIRVEVVLREGNQILGSARKDVTAGSVNAALNSGGLEDLINQLGLSQASQQ